MEHNIEEKWILFLKQFSNKQFDFSFFEDEKGKENYTIEQVLSLEVIVSNRLSSTDKCNFRNK
jgi:hypothetical protein